MMFYLTLIVFISTIQAFAIKHQRLECPFRDINDNLCLRSSAFNEFLAEYPQERNNRPDVSMMHATMLERISNDLCCYEQECLRECQVFENVIDNELSNEVTFFAQFFVDLSPDFFKNIDNDELQKLRNPLVFPDLLVQWKIKLAHYLDQYQNNQL